MTNLSLGNFKCERNNTVYVYVVIIFSRPSYECHIQGPKLELAINSSKCQERALEEGKVVWCV